jgi:hypothetical protein
LRFLELDVEKLGQPMTDLGARVRHVDLWGSEELVGEKVLSKPGRQEVRDGRVPLQQSTECGQVEDVTGRRRL